MQTRTARPRRSYAVAGVHRRPLASICVHEIAYCDLRHTARPVVGGPHGAEHAVTTGVAPILLASWSHGETEASGEPKTQAGAAEPPAPGASGGAVRPLSASFPVVLRSDARAHRARPSHPPADGGRADRARRPCRRSGHRLARDRHPARRHEARSPPAVPAPPPGRRQPSGPTGLTCASVKHHERPL
jgi:hypothetical protein